MSPLLSPETTLKDALSMMLDADVHAGIVVDRAGRVSGLRHDRIDRRVPARVGRPAAARARPAGPAVIDWGWVGDHLGALLSRTIQHLELAAIAVAFGFAISFGLALLVDLVAADLPADQRDRRDPVHDPEPGGLRRPGLDHRPVDLHGRDPAGHVHARDPRPEHRGRLRFGASRRPRSRRRDGLRPPRAVPRGSSCRSRCR